jgi:hypothetical protein
LEFTPLSFAGGSYSTESHQPRRRKDSLAASNMPDKMVGDPLYGELKVVVLGVLELPKCLTKELHNTAGDESFPFISDDNVVFFPQKLAGFFWRGMISFQYWNLVKVINLIILVKPKFSRIILFTFNKDSIGFLSANRSGVDNIQLHYDM